MKNPDYVTGALQIKIAITMNICGFQCSLSKVNVSTDSNILKIIDSCLIQDILPDVICFT